VDGPHVGATLLTHDAGNIVPPFPLDACGAETFQGFVDYMIQQALRNKLKKRGSDKHVVTLVPRVIVGPDCEAFGNPTNRLAHSLRRRRLRRFGHSTQISLWGTLVEDAGAWFFALIQRKSLSKLTEAMQGKELRPLERAPRDSTVTLWLGDSANPQHQAVLSYVLSDSTSLRAIGIWNSLEAPLQPVTRLATILSQ